MTRPETPAGATSWAPSALTARDRVTGAVMATAAFGLYASTACRTFDGGDSAELAAAAASFGVPHPPGYPLFVLLTGVVVRVLPLEPAFAANLATGLWGALAVGGLFLLARRLGTSTAAALLAAASFALGRTWWAQCVAAEVYSLDALLLIAVLHAAISDVWNGGRLVLASAVLGLWLSYRPINVLYLPFVAMVALRMHPPLAGDRRALGRVMLGVAVASLVYLYLPISSSRDPRIDVGDPDGWDRFWTVLRGAPYGRHWFASPMGASFGRMAERLSALGAELGAAAPLALLGAARAHQGAGPPRVIGWALVGVALVGLGLSGAYATLDVAVTFVPACVALALLGGLGVDAFRGDRRLALGGAIVVTAALGIVNLGVCDRSSRSIARFGAEHVLEDAPEGAAVLVYGDTTIHGVWYLQAIEGRRPDVLVVSPGHFSAWYREQLDREHDGIEWPAGIPDGSDRYLASWIADNVGRRRIFATTSVNLGPVLGRLRDLDIVPRGTLREIARRGTTVDLGVVAARAEGLLEELPEIERDGGGPHPDDASALLGHALALVGSADLLASTPRRALADRLYRRVLEMRPDDLDLVVRLDVARGIGQDVPPTRLASRATVGLEKLRRGEP